MLSTAKTKLFNGTLPERELNGRLSKSEIPLNACNENALSFPPTTKWNAEARISWEGKRVPYSQVDLVESTYLSTISIVELGATS